MSTTALDKRESDHDSESLGEEYIIIQVTENSQVTLDNKSISP